MRASAALSVVYPPGLPEISGYADGEKARMGDVMKLVCRSRGGNPLAQLVWFKNNEQVDFSYTTVSGRESVNEYSFTIDASDNNAVYRCEASSPLISPTPLVASVKMTVHCESLASAATLSLLPSSPVSFLSPFHRRLPSVPSETSSVASSTCRTLQSLQARDAHVHCSRHGISSSLSLSLLLPLNSPTHLLPQLLSLPAADALPLLLPLPTVDANKLLCPSACLSACLPVCPSAAAAAAASVSSFH